VSIEGSQCNRRLKCKSQKPAFKVVWDMMTEKWIFVKKYMQLGGWSLQRFLDTYKKSLSASNIEAIQNLS
jgi:hypothetical protein